ncbi:MAG: hypothetical protein LBU25_11680 [Treponema sp.]|jgi:hypothetical protein|nr:hypothetical protein [Treponema sp.]
MHKRTFSYYGMPNAAVGLAVYLEAMQYLRGNLCHSLSPQSCTGPEAAGFVQGSWIGQAVAGTLELHDRYGAPVEPGDFFLQLPSETLPIRALYMGAAGKDPSWPIPVGFLQKGGTS